MWVAGHDHGGQYVRDELGIPHLVPPAPLECEIGEKSYGHVDVFKNRFELNWIGKIPNQSIEPWPSVMHFD